MVKDILIELNRSDNPAELGLHLVAHWGMMDGKFEIWTGDAGRFKRISGIDCIAWYRWDNVYCEDCPDSKYEGSLWEYCGEGFRVHWDGHQWNARCTNPCAIYISIFEDVDPVAMEIEGFWDIIEYGGCISTHEKPKSLRRNPNKAPEIKVPWDPFW
jgi:hypothetical protein